MKQQQEVRSRATASSKLYFSPTSVNTSTSCQSFTVDVMVDPGTNVVSQANLYITYDPTLLDLTQMQQGSSFPGLTKQSIDSGTANFSVSVAGNVPVSSVTKVATLTFVPKATGNAQIQLDATKTALYATNSTSGPTPGFVENVLQLSSLAPANVTIGSNACTGGGANDTTPTVTGQPGQNNVTPTQAAGQPTSTPTPAGQPPVCTQLSLSPSASGSAPFAVLFTGQGNDPNSSGLITQANFTFGDGQNQNVTSGLNQQSVSTQTSHTYQTTGTFTANVTFTDNLGGTSAVAQTCSQNITVSGTGSGSATLTPTIAPTIFPTATPTLVAQATTAPTATPTLVEKPTIAPTGGIAQTMGTLGVIVMSIVGGFFLLTL